MNEQDKNNRNKVLISYIKDIISGYKVKAEYSTNDNDKNVIVVQQNEESADEIAIFFDNDNPMYNYFNIYIYGDSIQSEYEVAFKLGELIGQNIIIDFNENEKWQIIFKQYLNPRTIEYYDIRRFAYAMTFQCIVNRIQ